MAPTGAFPPNESAGLSARSCVTSQVHEALFWAIGPAGHRLNVFLRRRAPADLSIACLLSCLRSMGHVAAMLQAVQTRMFTGLRTPGCFSAPEAVLSEVEQRSDFVQAQTHLLSEFGGGF